eukprot:scaffold18426_cov101-Isochrysis_galbana.AAC.7
MSEGGAGAGAESGAGAGAAEAASLLPPPPRTAAAAAACRSFLAKAGMRSSTPARIESSRRSEQYSTERCCSSSDMEPEKALSCSCVEGVLLRGEVGDGRPHNRAQQLHHADRVGRLGLDAGGRPAHQHLAVLAHAPHGQLQQHRLRRLVVHLREELVGGVGLQRRRGGDQCDHRADRLLRFERGRGRERLDDGVDVPLLVGRELLDHGADALGELVLELNVARHQVGEQLLD